MGFFNFQFDDDVRYVKRLMAQQNYKEALRYMHNHTPIGIGYQYAEANLIMAQCEYYLKEYGQALFLIKGLVNMPIGDLTLKKDVIMSIKKEAEALKRKIENDQNYSNKSVKFPASSFADFMEPISPATSDCINEVFEGISEQLGGYYIKYSIKKKGESVQMNIYLQPRTDHEIEVFVYVDFIGVYFQKAEDEIVSFVLSQKYPTVAKLIKQGKKGSRYECGIFKTMDYYKLPTERFTPVLGKKVYVSDSVALRLKDLETSVEDVANMYWKLVKEISDNPITIKDNAEIALIAMAKGAVTKVAGVELGPKIKEILKSIFR